jgi:hypothetical protein
MAGTAIWLMRANRLEPAPLAPLEIMGEQRWQGADPVERAVFLDEVRPDPLRVVAREAEPAQDPVLRDPCDPLPVIADGPHIEGSVAAPTSSPH